MENQNENAKNNNGEGALGNVRLLLFNVMFYLAFAFAVRYPDNYLAFTYLSFLISFLIELLLLMSKKQDITEYKWFQILFQCSWSSNATVVLTTIAFFVKPQMIRDLNLRSTQALIEMVAMHYAPTLLHLIHLYKYPKLFRFNAIYWTLAFPIIYYSIRNFTYFMQENATGAEFISKNLILLVGSPCVCLSQFIGIWASKKFHPVQSSETKQEPLPEPKKRGRMLNKKAK